VTVGAITTAMQLVATENSVLAEVIEVVSVRG